MIEKTGLDLKVGDIIIGIDGQRHTVTAHDTYDLDRARVVFLTDTGLTVTLNRFESHLIYSVTS